MAEGRRKAPRRKAVKQRRGLPWGKIIAVVVALAVIGGLWVGYVKVKDRVFGPQDYSGSGTGRVLVSIPEGANGSKIGTILYKAGVVKSSNAYYRTALNDAAAGDIQPGTYAMKKKMSSSAALDALTQSNNRVQVSIVIPEGFRLDQIIARIAARTSITNAQLKAALAKPASIGLPSYADGNAEGFLFPATYTVAPGETATQLLSQMTAKSAQVMTSLNVDARAKALHLTREQIMTVASILEYEGKRDQDYPKIARVLYNRIDQGMKLQLDSTISYVAKSKGKVWTTAQERKIDSPYNTYLYKGLPPGPIGSAGEETLEAAMNPAKGSWLYFFAKKDGSTVFNDTYAQHMAACQAEYGKGSC